MAETDETTTAGSADAATETMEALATPGEGGKGADELSSEDAWLAAADAADETPGVTAEDVAALADVAAEPESEAQGGESDDVSARAPEKEEGNDHPAAPTVDAEALEASLTALRLDGYESNDLDGLPPEQVIRLGEKAKARQKKERKTLEDRNERIKELEARPEPTQEGTSAEPTPAVDLGESLKEPMDAIRADMGEEFATNLEGALRTAVEVAVASAPKPAAEESAGGNSAQLAEELALENAKLRVGERFPSLDLDDGETFGPIFEKARTLIAAGGYKGISGLYGAFYDATRLLHGEPKPPVDREETSRAKDLGQPMSTTQQRPPRSLTEDERQSAVLDALEAGKSPDEARRAGGF